MTFALSCFPRIIQTLSPFIGNNCLCIKLGTKLKVKNASKMFICLFFFLSFGCQSFFAQTRRDILDREKWEAEKKKTLEVVGEINEKFAISADYSIKYAKFLKQKKTGLSRIFPDIKCNIKTVVSVEEIERCADVPPVKGGGSLYSFRFNYVPDYVNLEKIIDLFEKSDIHYSDNKLMVGTPIIQAVISEIGEMEIEEINKKHKSLNYLKKIKWVKNKTKLQDQKKEFEQGLFQNGYFYSTVVEPKLNKVYVMRSIAYYQNRITFWNTDQTLVLKVVGIEKDGSLIILWRILHEEMSPEIKNK